MPCDTILPPTGIYPSCPSGCISFTSADNETAKGFGSISLLTSDLEITIEPVARSNRTAFAQRVAGRSP